MAQAGLRRYIGQSIRYLDHDIKEQLCLLLDADHGNNWRALKAQMETVKSVTDLYRPPLLVRNDGRQTQHLLDILSAAGVDVARLIHLLYRAHNYQAMSLFGIHYEDMPPEQNHRQPPPPPPGPPDLPVPQRPAVPLDIDEPNLRGPEQGRGAPRPAPIVIERGVDLNRAPFEVHRERDALARLPDQEHDIQLHDSFVCNILPREGLDHYRGVPMIEVQPAMSTYVRYSDPLKLRTEALGAEKFSWYHKNSSSDREAVLVQQGRVQNNIAEFSVDSASFEDRGWYWCMLENQYGPVKTRQVRVLVGTENSHDPSKPICVVTHPSPQLVQRGSSCQLVCHAFSIDGYVGQLFYQWIHFPLNEYGASPVKDGTSCVLNLENVSFEALGDYMCEVSRGDGERVFSSVARVSKFTKTAEYTAVDKVALLLGLSRYRSEPPLAAVKTDIAELTRILTKMDFRVISAVNQTKEAMRRTLAYFYHMVGKGVYGVVYVAGHGFEKDGRSYLKCYDCPSDDFTSEHSLCVSEIICKLQKMEAALITIFVDFCRVEDVVDNPRDIDRQDRRKTQYNYQASCNLIVFYATSVGMLAWEVGSSSVLVQALKLYLNWREPIQAVCDKIKEECKLHTAELREDLRSQVRELRAVLSGDLDPAERAEGEEKLNRLCNMLDANQVPISTSDLFEYRSLMDPIRYEGNSNIYNRAQVKWHNVADLSTVHGLARSYQADSMNITINVHFISEVSNVLDIAVDTVMTPQLEWFGYATVSTIYGLQNMRVEAELSSDEHLIQHKTTIENLDELKADLLVLIKLKKRVDMDNEDAQYQVVARINMGRPLLAGLSAN